MQSRWIAIGVMCFSAALLSACGGAPATALASKSDGSSMSKSDGRYDTSGKSDKDKDDCDESEDDKSSDKSRSLSTRSKDDDDKECKESDEDQDKSKGYDKSSLSLMSSKSSSKDKDGKEHGDDDANCKVTVCHVPPGNACQEHKIRVGKSAVRAHIEHGDYLGACDIQPPPPPPPPACIAEGLSCAATADCCPSLGLACLAGVCTVAG